jgi:hypothetical protein
LHGKSPRLPAPKEKSLARVATLFYICSHAVLEETAELLAVPPAAAIRSRSIGAENTVAAREEGPEKKSLDYS